MSWARRLRGLAHRHAAALGKVPRVGAQTFRSEETFCRRRIPHSSGPSFCPHSHVELGQRPSIGALFPPFWARRLRPLTACSRFRCACDGKDVLDLVGGSAWRIQLFLVRWARAIGSCERRGLGRALEGSGGASVCPNSPEERVSVVLHAKCATGIRPRSTLASLEMRPPSD